MVAVTLVAAACGTGDDPGAPGEGAGPAPTPFSVPQVAGDETEDVASALDFPTNPDHPEPLVDLNDLRSGGPPPDGIPAIDEPTFLAPDQVDFLSDDEPVLALEVDGEARAYPVQIMIWHEIVNDTVAGIPVTVSYCPLCNSALAYDRRVEDRVLDFGTSGLLYNSSLVMYDRQTESLWSHFTGEAVVGALTGIQLTFLPVATVSWADWRDANRDGLVLSRETGHERDYGVNPYPGYDDVDGSPFLFEGEADGRLAAMERIIGLRTDGDAVAVRLEAAAKKGVVAIDLDGRPVVVWLEPGTVSALDGGAVDSGREVGASGAFRPRVRGRDLTFERTENGFVDEQTGSTWDLFGEAVSGPLAGARLTPVTHVDTFWFAWAAFRPDSRIIPEGA